MRTKSSTVFKTTLLLVGFVLAVTAAADDRFSGAWKIKLEKSKFSPDAEPKSQIVRIEADENGVKVEAQGANADGSRLHYQYDAKFDGKDYPVTGHSYVNSVSIKRIDANTIESTLKKDGEPMITVTWKVSEDGQTRTSTIKGKDGKGNNISGVYVYEKMDLACGPKFCEKRCKGKCGNGADCDCPKK